MLWKLRRVAIFVKWIYFSINPLNFFSSIIFTYQHHIKLNRSCSLLKFVAKKIRCVWCWKGKWMNFQFFHDINEKLKKMRHSHLLRRKLILLTFDIKQIFSSCNYHFCHDCDVRVLFSCCCCADVWFNSQQEIYKNWVHICIRKFIIQLDIHE
jgi:hypothetical protein